MPVRCGQDMPGKQPKRKGSHAHFPTQQKQNSRIRRNQPRRLALDLTRSCQRVHAQKVRSSKAIRMTLKRDVQADLAEEQETLQTENNMKFLLAGCMN